MESTTIKALATEFAVTERDVTDAIARAGIKPTQRTFNNQQLSRLRRELDATKRTFIEAERPHRESF